MEQTNNVKKEDCSPLIIRLGNCAKLAKVIREELYNMEAIDAGFFFGVIKDDVETVIQLITENQTMQEVKTNYIKELQEKLKKSQDREIYDAEYIRGKDAMWTSSVARVKELESRLKKLSTKIEDLQIDNKNLIFKLNNVRALADHIEDRAMEIQSSCTNMALSHNKDEVNDTP